MLSRTVFGIAVIVFVLALTGLAQGQDQLQNYFSDTATKVRATTDPVEKREILNNSFEEMTIALNRVQGTPLVSKTDKAGIEEFKEIVKERQDELGGLNGFERVPDAQLDAFANYVVQDLEQADRMITISLTTLLLIIIIVLLIA